MTTSYSTLAEAITAIGSAEKSLLVTSAQSISADTTVPANIHLSFLKEGSFTIATGKTLTINGALSAGLYQIFSCTGTGAVVFGTKISEAWAEWFGAVGDGATSSGAYINKALSALETNKGILRFGGGTYLCEVPIENHGVSMLGSGKTILSMYFTNGNYGGLLLVGNWLLKTEIAGGFSHYPDNSLWDAITSASLAAGANSFTVADASGYVTGDVINIRAGHFDGDNNLPDWWDRVIITDVTGTTITFNKVFPYAINIVGAPPALGNPEYPNYIFEERSNVFQGCKIDGFKFTVHSSYQAGMAVAGAGTLINLSDYGVEFTNNQIDQYQTGIIMWGLQNSRLENLAFTNSIVSASGADRNPVAIRSFGSRDVKINNLNIQLGVSVYYQEGRNERVVFDGVHYNKMHASVVGNPALFRKGVNTGTTHFNNVELIIDHNCYIEDSYLSTRFMYRNLDIKSVGGDYFVLTPARNLYGKFNLSSQTWTLSLDDFSLTSDLFIVDILASQTGLKVNLPYRGYVKSVKIYMTSKTGITALTWAPPSAGDELNILAQVTAAAWEEINRTISDIEFDGFFFYLNDTNRDNFTADSVDPTYFNGLRYTSDGTVPGGTKAYVKIEYWKKESITASPALAMASGDFKSTIAGKGIVLVNAAGTVTKRVRLNDAGDGLLYEAE